MLTRMRWPRWVQRLVRRLVIVVKAVASSKLSSLTAALLGWCSHGRNGGTPCNHRLNQPTPIASSATALRRPRSSGDRMVLDRPWRNRPLVSGEVGESWAVETAASRRIRVGQEVTLWFGPLTAFLMLPLVYQRLNPQTFGETLRLAVLLCLLSMSQSILVSAGWTILCWSWNQPCGQEPPNDPSSPTRPTGGDKC